MVTADAGQVEHLRPSIASDARGHEVAPMRLGQQRRNDIATGIEIGGDEHELTEPGLSEVLHQNF